MNERLFFKDIDTSSGAVTISIPKSNGKWKITGPGDELMNVDVQREDGDLIVDGISPLINRHVSMRENGKLQVSIYGNDNKEYTFILTGEGLLRIIKARALRDGDKEEVESEDAPVQCGDPSLLDDPNAPKTMNDDDVLNMLKQRRWQV
jgi:hypothetical protein